jgi:hypothetical protein
VVAVLILNVEEYVVELDKGRKGVVLLMMLMTTMAYKSSRRRRNRTVSVLLAVYLDGAS